MSHVEIVKNGKKLGEIDERKGTVEISDEWKNQGHIEDQDQTKETKRNGNGC